MTRTHSENTDFISACVERTLAFLGFEPDDVELTYEYPAYGDGTAIAHWSAQTNIGDMIGQFQVPYFNTIHHHDVRRLVADGALQRHRELDGMVLEGRRK